MNELHLDYIEQDESKATFYPTPPELARELLRDIDWKNVHNILEPSAGKGDLVRAMYEAFNEYHLNKFRTPWRMSDGSWRIDCIELDSFLRSRLEEQGMRVIHDDFLTFEPQNRYDLIVMNPPFNNGAKHLLHALELIKRGGEVRCILNAETIRNPYSNDRKRLLQELGDDAQIDFMSGAFMIAERKTDVDVAIIRKKVAKVAPNSRIVDDMRKAPTYKVQRQQQDGTDMVQYNAIDEWVNRYNFEVACGIRLIEEYVGMLPHLVSDPNDKYAKPLLQLSGVANEPEHLDDSVNNYIKDVRRKYWRILFRQPMIVERLTNNLVRELYDSVDDLVDYDFSSYNILTLMVKMGKRLSEGVETTIVRLFDDWTKHSYYEGSPNVHYYNGWRTNGCYALNKRVIIPFYRSYNHLGDWFVASQFTTILQDIEKVMNYLDGGRTEDGDDLFETLQRAKACNQYKNIDTKYFTVSIHKKGTMHLTFKDMDLLDKFNIFAGKHKNWLPSDYGRKQYSDLTDEERAVVDSFQGRERYEEICSRPEYYLDDGAQLLMLNAGM